MSRKPKFSVGSTKNAPASTDGGGLLGEFIQDRRTSAVAAQQPTRVHVAELVGNPDNPREDLGDLDELATSLTEHGLRQPVNVMSREAFLDVHPHYEQAVGTASWVVINGNRRLAAAQKAGLETLPVYVGESTGDVGTVRTAVLVENIHRKDLDPLEEARAIQELCEITGWSQSEVAHRLGKTGGWVSQRLTLLQLVPELQDELRTGELTLKEARSIGRLEPDEQRAAWRDRLYPVNGSADASDDSVIDADHTDGSVYPVNPSSTASTKPTSESSAAGTQSSSALEARQSQSHTGSDSGPVQLTLSLEWPGQDDDQAAEELAERIYEGLGKFGSQEREAVLEALTRFR